MSPAWRRASRALSPAGTTKTSTPGPARADRLLLDAADGRRRRRRARSRRSPRPRGRGRRRGRAPRGCRARTRARPRGRRRRRRRSGRRSAAGCSRRWSTRTPMQSPGRGRAGPRSSSSAISSRSSPRRTSSVTRVPGCLRPTSCRRSPGVRTALAVDRDDDVGRLQLRRRPACRGRRVVDERAGRLRLDVVAELAKRDGRRDLLRPAHLAQALPGGAPTRSARSG